jgi:putative redox protein
MSGSLVRATWAGDRLWDTGRPNGPLARFDGDSVAAQSPVDALLSSLAACAGTDVVDILVKRRTPPTLVTIDVAADRRAEAPRRVTALQLVFRVDGEGIERVHAERAVMLAFEKYCSVASSLAPDIVVTSSVVLNGEAGAELRPTITG